MKCGCWVVGDGNNRIGLILKSNRDATIADIPKDLLVTSKFGEWENVLILRRMPFYEIPISLIDGFHLLLRKCF